MDAVSNCIVELIFQNERLPPVLNLVHPKPTDWNTVIKLIGKALVSQKRLKSPLSFVSFQNWFSILEERHAQLANEQNGDELRIVRSFFVFFFLTMSM